MSAVMARFESAEERSLEHFGEATLDVAWALSHAPEVTTNEAKSDKVS